MNSKNLSIKSIGMIAPSHGRNHSHLAEEINTRIFSRIEVYMNIPAHLATMYRDQIEKGVIDMGNEAQRESFFVSVLMTHTEGLYSFSFGSEDGEYYGARRNADNEIEIMRNDRSTGGTSWYYSLSENYTGGKPPFPPSTSTSSCRTSLYPLRRLSREVTENCWESSGPTSLCPESTCPSRKSQGEKTVWRSLWKRTPVSS